MMTDSAPPSPSSTPLDAPAIIAWLKAHPDFLHAHPELCDVLLPPKQTTGKGVVDFQSYMIERLKADKSEAVATAQEIAQNARHNMNNQTRIHRAVLQLLEAESFESFIEAITLDLTTILDVDITALIIEAEGEKIPHITTPGLRMVPEKTITHWLAGKTILHQSDIGGIEAIYGSAAGLVKSQVLIKLEIGDYAPPALLAFGSRDPHMFHPAQGTEQILFLAHVVERLFRAWLHVRFV